MKKVIRILNRIKRVLILKKGIYGNFGKSNHFSKGVLIYENAIIGHNNYFSPYVIVNNAKIGNYCSIGPQSMIGLGEHDMNAISTFPNLGNGQGRIPTLNINAPSIIENDVWIGANVTIRQGVKICNGAVVGANSVVTHDVKPYEIVAGCPARVIGKRFDDSKIIEILNLNWFEKDFNDAKKIISNYVKRNEDRNKHE